MAVPDGLDGRNQRLVARLADLSSRARFATTDGERFVVIGAPSQPRVVATLLPDWMPEAEE